MHAQHRRTAVGIAFVAAIAGAACARPPVGVASTRSPATRFLVSFAPRRHVAGHDPHGLAVMDRHGRVLRVLSRARFGTFARWSPSGAAIAWKDPDGIHVENADGSDSRLLVPTATSCTTCQALSFVWSRDERSLAVGSAGPNGDELLLVAVDGSGQRTLAASTTPGTFFTPAFWTPSGASLVYGATGTTLAHPGAVIRELTLGTGRTRTLWSTANAQGARPPLISPDGRTWAYISEVDQYHQRLRLIDTATGNAHPVKGVNPTNLVAWSPDSHALAVVESGSHVVTVARNGTLLRRVGLGRQIEWGRGGELFIVRGDDNQIWASENGRPERFLFRLPRNAFVVFLDAT